MRVTYMSFGLVSLIQLEISPNLFIRVCDILTLNYARQYMHLFNSQATLEVSPT